MYIICAFQLRSFFNHLWWYMFWTSV